MGEDSGQGASPDRSGQRTRRAFGWTLGAVAALAGFSLVAVQCAGLRKETPAGDRLAQADVVVPVWSRFPAATVADVCTVGVCVGGNVLLPVRQPIETAVDVTAPETLGALTVERIWTGSRGGLFGAGWESVWDVKLVGGRLTGPVPARPLKKPRAGHAVALDDGSSLGLDNAGRVDEVCLDGSYCVKAERTKNTLNLVARLGPTADATANEPLVMVLTRGQVTSATYRGHAVDYGYGPDGRLSTVKGQAGTTTYGYEKHGLSMVDEEGSIRTFGYDSTGEVTGSSGLDGGHWSFARSEAGSPTPSASSTPTPTSLAPLALPSTTTTSVTKSTPVGDSTFDVVGPGGVGSSYRFERGVLVRAEVGSCVTLERTLDGDGMLTESHPADGVTITYQADGRLRYTETRSSSPPKTAVMTIDERGRVTESESAEGTTSITYAGDSARPVSVTSNGQTTKLRYNDRGMLLSSQDPDGYRVAVSRNNQGLPISLTDETLQIDFSYDAYGRTVSERSGDGSATATYRPDGLLRSITDRGGREAATSYDDLGDLTQLGTSIKGKVPAENASAAACPASTPNTAIVSKRAGGATEYRYPTGDIGVFDAAGRPVEVTTSGRTTDRLYDDEGRLSELGQPGDDEYHLSYTRAGRLARDCRARRGQWVVRQRLLSDGS